MSEPGTLEVVATELASALQVLDEALESEDALRAMLLDMGWTPAQIPQPLLALAAGAAALAEAAARVAGGATSPGDYAQLLARVGSLAEAIEDLEGKPYPPALAQDGFGQHFPGQLVQYLLIEYLTRRRQKAAFVLKALGVLRYRYEPAAGGRPGYVRRELVWDDLPLLLEDPVQVFENAYGWRTDQFDSGAVLQGVMDLMRALRIPAFRESLDDEVAGALQEAATPQDVRPALALDVPLFASGDAVSEESVGLRLTGLPERGAELPGLALLPYVRGAVGETYAVTDWLRLVLRGSLALDGGVAVKLRPGGLELVTGLNDPDNLSAAAGELVLRLENGDAGAEPTLVLGSPDGSRVEYRTLSLEAAVRLAAGRPADLGVELELEGGRVVIRPDAGDGFLRSLMPADGIAADLDLAFGISQSRGFYFRGSGGLEIRLPAHLSLGPVELLGLTLAVRPAGGAVPVTVGASASAKLGPLVAVVEDFGLRADLAFPGSGGSLGPLDLELGFKPPNGVGLSVDAGVVKGGGYLYFDTEREEYAGALELVFSGFLTLKAVGLVTTRMPDGSKGFSLLVIITAEFGSGIQLGFGFTLLGVGGLLGLNRTMRLEPLAEGIRTGGLNSVLFPKDVVANAPKIISDLRTFFPPQAGTFLIGPMARLGWGTPTLVSLSLGIIIEIPGNVAILGVLKVALPDEKAALLVLQVSFIGAIEFDKKRVWFFASLFESRVLFMTLEGEMGLLAGLGGDASFVVSVGGFHPRFTPPPLPFPSPKRVAVDVLNNGVQRIRVEGYFAVTSNTAQFGARCEVFFGLDAINVSGHIGFDALFQFSPFYFVIDLSASFGVKVFGIGLFSVDVRMSLEGPTPWRAHGTGSLSLLFFDIEVDFDVTWGEKKDTTLPPIQVMPLLAAELGKPQNWRASLPAGSDQRVSLRKLPEDEAALVLHPVGVLRVSQRAVPLGLTLDKVGNRKAGDVKRVTLSVATGGLGKRGDVREPFAPAQFQEMTRDEKLSRPAFGPELAGLDLSVAGEQLASSRVARRTVRYEEIVIDTAHRRFRRRFFPYAGALFAHFARGGSVSLSELSRFQKDKLQPFQEKIKVKADGYAVAFQADNKGYAADSVGFASEASAREYLKQRVEADPALAQALHVIPEFERAA